MEISIEDANDSPPQFLGEPYTYNAIEGVSSLQLRAYVTARDMDLGDNSHVIFSLHESHQTEFTITTLLDRNNYVVSLNITSITSGVINHILISIYYVKLVNIFSLSGHNFSTIGP